MSAGSKTRCVPAAAAQPYHLRTQATSADQLPSGLGVQADARRKDYPWGGSKAAKHKKTRPPKLNGSPRKAEPSAAQTRSTHPQPQRRLGNGHSRLSAQLVWRARARWASECAHSTPFVWHPWKGVWDLGRKNTARYPSRVEGASRVLQGLITTKPAAGFERAQTPFKSVTNGTGLARANAGGRGGSNELWPRS